MTDGEDPARAACRELCAQSDEPPCFEIWADCAASGQMPPVWEPCDHCLIIADLEADTPQPLDPNAVIRQLL